MSEKRFASLISAIFHPFLWIALAFLGVLWLSRQSIPHVFELGFLYVVLAAGLPIFILFWLHKAKLSADIYLSKIAEREKFLPVELAMVVPALVVVMYTASLSRAAYFYLAILALSMLVYIGLLRWIKMSVHIGVLTAIGWSMVLLLGWKYGLFLLLLLPVGWARRKMRQHTWTELSLGFVVVTLVVFVAHALVFG